MNDKGYENKNQYYGNYTNKSYSTSQKEIGPAVLNIIFFLIICISVTITIVYKEEDKTSNNPKRPATSEKSENPRLAELKKRVDPIIPISENSVSPKTQSKNVQSSDLDVIIKVLEDSITEKDLGEIEKKIESANLNSLNEISLKLKKLLRDKSEELRKIRFTIKEDKTKNASEKLKEFKIEQKKHYKIKRSVEEVLSKINQKRTILEKSLNIKNIKNFYKMDEQQLKDELNDFISGNYTYSKNEYKCSMKEVQKEFISTSINKNYPKLLDEIITKCSEKKQLDKDQEYYYEAYYSLWSNHSDCFKVFMKHGLDLEKVHDRNNKDNTIIHLAASKGEVEILKYALENGIPIDQRTYFNLTPLYIAIKENKYEAVEFLIEQGALAERKLDEYNNYGNILYFPIKNKNYKMLELLVNNGILLKEDLKIYTNDRKILRFILSKGQQNNEPQTNIQDKEWEEAYKCIKEGNLEKFKDIEYSGKDLSKMYYDGEPAICIAVENNRISIVEYLIQKYDCKKMVDSINGRNALHYAAMGPSIKILEILLQNDFNPNELDNDKNTPINLALCNNYSQPGFVNKLLEKKADPNILNQNNQNSLFFAPNLMHIQSIKPLFEKVDNINLQDSAGNTPLHHFLLKSPERYKFISTFLENGANINLVNHKMQTPLHLAILSNDANAVWQILNKGADINQKDIDGNTGLHYVAQYAPNDNMLKEIQRSRYNIPDLTIQNNEGKTPLDLNPKCFEK